MIKLINAIFGLFFRPRNFELPQSGLTSYRYEDEARKLGYSVRKSK